MQEKFSRIQGLASGVVPQMKDDSPNGDELIKISEKLFNKTLGSLAFLDTFDRILIF